MKIRSLSRCLLPLEIGLKGSFTIGDVSLVVMLGRERIGIVVLETPVERFEIEGAALQGGGRWAWR